MVPEGVALVQAGQGTEMEVAEERVENLRVLSEVCLAVAVMGLGYVVLTSVDRDDLPDGGA